MMKLLHGNCLEKMKDIKENSIDMILCDLPYGTTKSKWDKIIPMRKYIKIDNNILHYDDFLVKKLIEGKSLEKIDEEWESCANDGLWDIYLRIIKDDGAIVLFGKEPFSSSLRTSNIENYKYDWLWIKDTKSNFMQANHQPLNNIETISVFSKGYARNIKNGIKMKYNPQYTEGKEYRIPKDSNATDLFKENHKNGKYIHYARDTKKRYPYNTLCFNVEKNKVHPTQKPVELLEYLIKTYTNEQDIVLDNCMGSGSTGVACLNTRRRFIGIEINDDYFEISKRRIGV